MAVKWIAEAWRNALALYHDYDRVYIDFRQLEYPPYADTTTYTLITSANNQPGSHNLTGGRAKYFLDLTDTVTVIARIKPSFGYEVASNQHVWSWYNDADHYLTLYYDATSDKYTLKWKDGTNERVVVSAAYVSNVTLMVWVDIAITLDLTTGDTTGVVMYLDRVAKDSAWDDAADTKASNFPVFEVAAENQTAGNFDINYVRIFTSKQATATEIGVDMSSVKLEEIFFPLNGHAHARTRCNITEFVSELTVDRMANRGANEASIELASSSGEFADDQYAAFDAANAVYNGTAAQAYMKHRCPVFIETWYGHSFEPILTGRVDENLFTRRTPQPNVDISRVILSIEDYVSDIARKVKRFAADYGDKKLSDATEADSLIHVITRLVTKESIYNFLANSSFENGTIASSWLVAGTAATFSRVAGGLTGSYQGDLVYGSATAAAYQSVTFIGTKRLNVGETYTFQVYLKSAGNCGNNIRLSECDGGGVNDYTETTWAATGGAGWSRAEITHTITDSDSTYLLCAVYLDDNVTLSFDCAMLVQYDRALNWFILNNNNGAAGVESADDADSDSYDILGFDCDAVNITHPWVFIEEDDSLWTYLKDLGDACIADYLGLDSAGTMKLRSYLKTGYSDPSPILTISSVLDVAANQEVDHANKIKVHGIKLKKDSDNFFGGFNKVWDAEDAGLFSGGEKIKIEIANAGTWPAAADYGEFWAKYKVYD